MKLGALTKEPVTEAGRYLFVVDGNVDCMGAWSAPATVGETVPAHYSRTLTPLQLGADERDGEIAELKAKLFTEQFNHNARKAEIATLRARIAALESPPKVEEVERPGFLGNSFLHARDIVPNTGMHAAVESIRLYALSLERETKRLQARVADEERGCMAVLTERDRLNDLLDKFVEALGGVERHGEHSSANDPWERALEYADELEENYGAWPSGAAAESPPADPDAEPVPYLGVVTGGMGAPIRWANAQDLLSVCRSFVPPGKGSVSFDDNLRLALHGKLALARAAKGGGA